MLFKGARKDAGDEWRGSLVWSEAAAQLGSVQERELDRE